MKKNSTTAHIHDSRIDSRIESRRNAALAANTHTALAYSSNQQPPFNGAASAPFTSGLSAASSYNTFNNGYNNNYNNPGFNNYNNNYSNNGFGNRSFGYQQQQQQQTTGATSILYTIEGMVSAFSSLSNLLESTLSATHSSVLAIATVLTQLHRLKSKSVDGLLGLHGILKYLKQTFNVTNFNLNPRNLSLNKSLFKPLLILGAIFFGVPFILNKIMLNFQRKRLISPYSTLPTPTIEQTANQRSIESIPPKKDIQFYRAEYDFIPEDPTVELKMNKGDLIAILNKSDPNGNPSQWWKARNKKGQYGYVPCTYLEKIELKNDYQESNKHVHKELQF